MPALVNRAWKAWRSRPTSLLLLPFSSFCVSFPVWMAWLESLVSEPLIGEVRPTFVLLGCHLWIMSCLDFRSGECGLLNLKVFRIVTPLYCAEVITFFSSNIARIGSNFRIPACRCAVLQRKRWNLSRIWGKNSYVRRNRLIKQTLLFSCDFQTFQRLFPYLFFTVLRSIIIIIIIVPLSCQLIESILRPFRA